MANSIDSLKAITGSGGQPLPDLPDLPDDPLVWRDRTLQWSPAMKEFWEKVKKQQRLVAARLKTVA